MLRIDLSRRAEKFLRNLDSKYARQLATKIQQLRVQPHPQDSKQFKGHAPPRRAEFGEYRIIYSITNDLLIIALIGKKMTARFIGI